MKLARRISARFALFVDEITKDPRRARFTSALVLGGEGRTSLCRTIAHRATCDHDTTIRAFEQIEDAPLPTAFINALIVVVDSDRCENLAAIESICCMLSGSLTYVCIFVDDAGRNVGDLKATLLAETGATVEIIYGSPNDGKGIDALKARLAEIG